MNVGILGLGEVGSAIKKLVEKKHSVFTKDREDKDFGCAQLNVLHICIPYDDNFVKTIVEIIRKYRPTLTLIESTVAPGTTDFISKKVKTLLCHSPIRGVHPNLYKGIKTFVKYIGPTSKKSGRMAKKYYQELGLTTEIFQNAIATEVAKIMDTTYYGWNILFEKEMYNICKKYNAPFDESYTKWNITYNIGYSKLGMHHVVRPVLKHMEGKIGGHCVISNCKILEKKVTNIVSKIILKSNQLY